MMKSSKRTFLVLVLDGLGIHAANQLQFFGVSGLGVDLGYCHVKWFALET